MKNMKPHPAPYPGTDTRSPLRAREGDKVWTALSRELLVPPSQAAWRRERPLQTSPCSAGSACIFCRVGQGPDEHLWVGVLELENP